MGLQFPSAPFMAETCKLKVKFYANSTQLDSMEFNKVIGFLSRPHRSNLGHHQHSVYPMLLQPAPALLGLCYLLFFTSTLQIFMAESSANNKIINCSDDASSASQDTGHWSQDPAGKSIFKMNYVCRYSIRVCIYMHIYL